MIIREDVLENPSDPRPNAFFDARTGMLRVYHGPMYGNPGGSLVPLQAQHVPIGTPAPPTSAWTNPWAGMMGGMTGRWPFSVNQRSLVTKRMEKLKNLDQESSRLWTHVASDYFDFDLCKLADVHSISFLTPSSIRGRS